MHRLKHVMDLHGITHHNAGYGLTLARIDFNQIRIFQFETCCICNRNLNIGFSAVGEQLRHQPSARHGVPLIADAASVECELCLRKTARHELRGHKMGATICGLKFFIGERLCPAPLRWSQTVVISAAPVFQIKKPCAIIFNLGECHMFCEDLGAV